MIGSPPVCHRPLGCHRTCAILGENSAASSAALLEQLFKGSEPLVPSSKRLVDALCCRKTGRVLLVELELQQEERALAAFFDRVSYLELRGATLHLKAILKETEEAKHDDRQLL